MWSTFSAEPIVWARACMHKYEHCMAHRHTMCNRVRTKEMDILFTLNTEIWWDVKFVCVTHKDTNYTQTYKHTHSSSNHHFPLKLTRVKKKFYFSSIQLSLMRLNCTNYGPIENLCLWKWLLRLRNLLMEVLWGGLDILPMICGYLGD